MRVPEMVPPALHDPPIRSTQVTAVIADDDPIVRRLLRTVLETDGVRVVGEALDQDTLLAEVAARRPAVVVVDTGLPASGGLNATRRVVNESSASRVILLAPHEDATVAVEGLRCGASGYLTKDVVVRALPRCVRAVADGQIAISRELVTSVVGALRVSSRERVSLRPVKSRLTDREWEVLDLLCEDLSTAAIAESLFLSPETVRSHVKHITRKLGVSGRAEAVAVAASLRGQANAPVAAGERPA